MQDIHTETPATRRHEISDALQIHATIKNLLSSLFLLGFLQAIYFLGSSDGTVGK